MAHIGIDLISDIKNNIFYSKGTCRNSR